MENQIDVGRNPFKLRIRKKVEVNLQSAAVTAGTLSKAAEAAEGSAHPGGARLRRRGVRARAAGPRDAGGV